MKSESSQRRFLSFPAVHPCEAISPATLLRSLITLAGDIDGFRSETFTCHRRSAREAIRQVGAILEFLQDISSSSSSSSLSKSTVLSFSELHVTLQKIRLLLGDCSSRGARLWLLVRSDRVSGEFRLLIRSIATSLDVLPLDFVDSSPEIKELVRLISWQAWKVPIETDADDERVAGMVRSIMKQFEHGYAPDTENVEEVMDHLKIKNWAECNEEISFLESELFSCEDSIDAGVLSSLMAFMVYCRAVLFHSDSDSDSRSGIANRRSKQSTRFQKDSLLSDINLEDLKCPISLELMTDPVTLSTGQTYNRSSIKRWFDSGCLTCPVTGEKLTNANMMVPNSTLRKLAEQLCRENNIQTNELNNNKRDLSKTVKPGGSAAAIVMRMTASYLVDMIWTSSSEQVKAKAAYEIRLLTKSNLFNRDCFVQSGAVPWLLKLSSSSNPSAQEHSVAALLNISKVELGRIAIFENGGLLSLLRVLTHGIKVEARQNAAAILFYLSSIDEYRKVIGEAPEAIPALVDLLKRGTYRGKKNAVVTLFGLLIFPGNLPKVIAAGAVPALINILSIEKEDLIDDTTAVLARIAEKPEGAKVILRSSALPSVVQVLRSSTSRSGKEHCVALLLSLCHNGGTKVARLLDEFTTLMPSLYSLLTEGSPHTAKKARALLNHLHHSHEESCPAGSVPPQYQQDQWSVSAQ
ncbi:U-box domain-containing protein 19-like [Dioscorea cayenensis subsp. rotundata]|uniref:RING-type E3 ubiquitin transferase n=1 Tax=Dioscorea cayennensis subsp. rotundata TaxID=55577 RepID=A0AB40BSQ2_DIOCR|nr:U-box domain-containing protein 19-like [Dioscorea cayenensis subsp. rotundata]